jgi:hypothetical protein
MNAADRKPVPEGKSMNSKLLTSFALPICVLAGCGMEPMSGTEPAAAAPPAASAPSAATASPAQHCVSGPSGEATCYATFTEAIAAATGGEIADAPADARLALADERFANRINAIALKRAADLQSGALAAHITPASTVVIGISYLDANYGGNTWVWNQPYGCDGNPYTIDFEVYNLNMSPYANYGFNDNISSFHSYSNCQTVLYEDWYWGGSATNGGVPIADMSWVGAAMNDRASSIRWF